MLQIKNATYTADCHTVTVATVNGLFPGPPVEITEGDTLVVEVTNKQVYPVTMHWCVSLSSISLTVFISTWIEIHVRDFKEIYESDKI
jgi:hypothetical protein